MDKWKIRSSSFVLDNKWVKIRQDKVELPNGKVIDDYFVWESDNHAMVVPFTSDNKLIFVKQYKHGIGEIMIEFPAGYVGKDEKPEDAVKREFEEETGYVSDDITFLRKVIHYPTKETGCLYLFLAKNVKKEKEIKLDSTENIEILEVTIKEALDMIQRGEIWASGTICALYLALEKMKLLKII